MIFYIFNHYYPDASGFGRRCKREIESLSTIDDITIICRQRESELEEEQLSKKINVVRFSAGSEVVHRPQQYSGTGWYEIQRNLDLLVGCFITLWKSLSKIKNDQKSKVFVVTSPLTIPLFTWIIALIHRVELTVVSFHDLEPELAMHIKHLTKNHWLVRLEKLLEFFVCHRFKKIIVTTQGQAEILSSRTGIRSSRFEVIPNVTDIPISVVKNVSPIFSAKSIVLGYMSTLSFNYTIKGLLIILSHWKEIKEKIPKLKMLIIGGGEGLEEVSTFIKEHELEQDVLTTGHVNFPATYMVQCEAAIIPWEKDEMTTTMLPSKLFEFLGFGIPVIAPNFGEFRRVLLDRKNAVLYDDINELIEKIQFINEPTVRKKIAKQGKRLYHSEYDPSLLKRRLLEFWEKE